MHIAGKIADILMKAGEKVATRLNSARLERVSTPGPDVVFTREARIHNGVGRESIKIGQCTMMMSELMTIAPQGKIEIGRWCYLGPNTKVWARERIEIGDRVFISHGVQIFDNNSHSLSAAERHDRFHDLMVLGAHQLPETVKSAPVRIGDDVWIGFNCAIMKGVTIGKGAVVGACTVLTHDVPEFAIMVGNPARQVGTAKP